jgi:hypothetical protein
MKLTRSVPIALAFSLAAAGAYAGQIITIDPDGPGGTDPSINILALGWNTGNSIAVAKGQGDLVPAPTPGSNFDTYGQAVLANFNGVNSQPIGGLQLNSTYEWTYVFGYEENVSLISTPAAAVFTATGASGPTQPNFFQIWVSPLDSNMLQGTGFQTGTKILEGTVRAADGTSGVTNFTRFGINNALLDANGVNNYPGITSNTGVGSTKLTVDVNTATLNADYFLTTVTSLSINVDSFLNQPFIQTDPSSCFWNGSALFTGAGNHVSPAGGPCGTTGVINGGSVGFVNGVSGPNVMFQTRATNDFIPTIPEPGSIALLGIGLVSLGAMRRRRQVV